MTISVLLSAFSSGGVRLRGQWLRTSTVASFPRPSTMTLGSCSSPGPSGTYRMAFGGGLIVAERFFRSGEGGVDGVSHVRETPILGQLCQTEYSHRTIGDRHRQSCA